MHILVLNSGSSSIKFSFFESGDGNPVPALEGEISGIGGAAASFTVHDGEGTQLVHESAARINSADQAIEFIARAVTGEGMPAREALPAIDAIGYRIVHPGANLHGHQKITDAVLEDLRQAANFAPLHDPEAISLIEHLRGKLPHIDHYACFDTVFHAAMPLEASTYPLPPEYTAKGVRRYGFHGLSCESIVAQLRESDLPFPSRLIIAHLGGGCSVTAVLDGVSIDTSMGLTPTGGIVMATRPGDLDPGLILYLLRQQSGDVAAVERMLNHASGLAALSGISGDMRHVRAASAKGDAQASLALKIFTRSVKKTVGGYIALMGGVDAIVFTGGIGEHDTASRVEILDGMEQIGITLDKERNRDATPGPRNLSAQNAVVAIYTLPAKEDLMIARHVAQLAHTEPHF